MRIHDRFFCFSAAAFVTVATMLYMFFATPLSNMPGTITWGFFSALAICTLIYNVFKAIQWTSRAWRFKKAFKVNPPDFPDGDWKQMLAIQPIVDEHLKTEAVYLQAAYDAENVIFQKKPENLEQAMERAKEIAIKSTSVKIFKKYFWQLHNLAWEWGFEVWNSHTDYISALDRAGKAKRKKQF